MIHFEIFIDKEGQYRFHAKGENGEIIGDNYHQLAKCKHAIRLLKIHAADAKVFLCDGDGGKEETAI